MLAFAAERRAAAQCCWAPSASAAVHRHLPPRTALSSKPAARRGCDRMIGPTDRRTAGRTLDRFIETNPHTMPAVSMILLYSKRKYPSVPFFFFAHCVILSVCLLSIRNSCNYYMYMFRRPALMVYCFSLQLLFFYCG